MSDVDIINYRLSSWQTNE